MAGGGSVIDPRVVESMLTARTRRTTALQHLTAREREVLAEMATGASNATIGERLFITVRAVERHINSIFAKLGLTEDGDVHRRVQPYCCISPTPAQDPPLRTVGQPHWAAKTLSIRSYGTRFRRGNRNVLRSARYGASSCSSSASVSGTG